MKLPILLLLLPAVLFGQNNFKLEDNDLIWQKVHETALSFEDLSNNLINSGIFSQYEIYGNTITGDLKSFEAKYEDAGYSTGTTPMVISGHLIDTFSLVEYKEGKYRVTLKRITLTKMYDDPFTQQGERSTLKSWVTNKKGDFRNWFKNHSIIYDVTFNELFSVRETENDDW